MVGDLHLWVPKKDTHTEALGSGEFSLYVQNGVDSAGVSSSEIVTSTDDGADLVSSGIIGPFFDPVAESGGPSSDLVGFTLPSSNPVRSASAALLLASTSHGGQLASSSKQRERVKVDLHGLGLDGYGYEKGYVSHVEDDQRAAGNTDIGLASGLAGTMAEEGKEQSTKNKTGSGAEELKGGDLGGKVKASPVKSWKNLFSMPEKSSGPLQFYRPHNGDGKIVVKPPAGAVNEGIYVWKGCLVEQFLDKRLPFPVVRSLVNKLWGKKEMLDISTTENGLYFFIFRDPEARDWVLDSGPWHLAGRPFILRAWHPGMDMLNIQLSSIPIWVKFYNIPLEYWTSTCLGYIASNVDIPLHLDSLTENQTKLSFARICVKVGVDCEFPKSVLLDRGNGNFSTIRIEYPWAPQCCPVCKRFGHNLENCQVKKAPSSNTVPYNPGNIVSVAGDVLFADDMNVTQGTRERKKSAGDSSVVPDDGLGSSSVQISDAVPCVKEVISMENEVMNQLHGNTFECLAQSEEEETAIALVSSRFEPNNNSEFSDYSHILDTFKHIKKVDELDFTPVPISQKKLKKLKNRILANMQDPVVRGHTQLPNG